MGKTTKYIMDIVWEIREQFEHGTIPREMLGKLYQQYNSDVEANSFIEKAQELFPKLNCGLASVYLKSKLGGEIVRGTYADENHTFLLLDGKVVDITADQYGGPKVYVGELKFPWAHKKTKIII